MVAHFIPLNLMENKDNKIGKPDKPANRNNPLRKIKFPNTHRQIPLRLLPQTHLPHNPILLTMPSVTKNNHPKRHNNPTVNTL